jgi:hypothetical protein
MHTTCYVCKYFIGIKTKSNAHLRMLKETKYKSRRSFTTIIAVVNIRVTNLISCRSQGRLHMAGTKQSFPEMQSFRHQAD